MINRSMKAVNAGTCNIFCLVGICGALITAYYYQLYLKELPCPLCLLQRAGLMICGTGFTLNIFCGGRRKHYALILAGAIVTFIIAARQVLLNIQPGSGGFGSTLMGLHLYTWSLIAAVTLPVVTCGIIMAEDNKKTEAHRLVARCVGGLFVLLVACNVFTTLLECGAGHCTGDKQCYRLLSPHLLCE
ncbi:disulfide bond formation protein B [Salmonella enterica]|nr:disulfide bond formation protein B [Salmonella enterica]